MKAKVISAFIDKPTGDRYTVGSDYEGASSRIDELAGKGLVAPIRVDPPKRKTRKD